MRPTRWLKTLERGRGGVDGRHLCPKCQGRVGWLWEPKTAARYLSFKLNNKASRLPAFARNLPAGTLHRLAANMGWLGRSINREGANYVDAFSSSPPERRRRHVHGVVGESPSILYPR